MFLASDIRTRDNIEEAILALSSSLREQREM